MGILITDIAAAVQSGADDTALDAIIQQFITDWGLSETVAEWRLNAYAVLRLWAYPTLTAQERLQLVLDADFAGSYAQIINDIDARFSDLPASPATTAETEPYYITANSTDTFTITDIPSTSVVTVSGPPYPRTYPDGAPQLPDPNIYPSAGISWPVTTGTFIFKVDTSAEYRIRVSSPGAYADKEFIVYGLEEI